MMRGSSQFILRLLMSISIEGVKRLSNEGLLPPFAGPPNWVRARDHLGYTHPQGSGGTIMWGRLEMPTSNGIDSLHIPC